MLKNAKTLSKRWYHRIFEGSNNTRAAFTKKKPDQAQKAQAAFVPLSLM